MTHLSYVERQQRIQKDQGDPEDSVFVSRGQHSDCYHNTEDCMALNESREITRRLAQNRVMSPCMMCVLGEYKGGCGTGGKSHLQKAIEEGEVPESLMGGAD